MGREEYTSTGGTTFARRPLQEYDIYAVHHLEPHVVSTGSEELPAEVVNHLAYTARVVKTVASAALL